jgi:hypothetical protein
MPRPKSLIPKLLIDKSRNRAFCKVDGKFVVLGPAGSTAAQRQDAIAQLHAMWATAPHLSRDEIARRMAGDQQWGSLTTLRDTSIMVMTTDAGQPS